MLGFITGGGHSWILHRTSSLEKLDNPKSAECADSLENLDSPENPESPENLEPNKTLNYVFDDF